MKKAAFSSMASGIRMRKRAGIAADQQEEQLPDDGRAVKAVVKFRMRDGRRVQRVEAAFGKQSPAPVSAGHKSRPL
jgi:hypothetical protein